MIIGIIYGLYFKTSIVLFFILIGFILVIKREKINKYIYNKKKIILIMLISMIFFSSYINVLNYKYDKIYKTIKDISSLEAVIVSRVRKTKYYSAYTVKAEGKKFILYTNENNLRYGMKVKIDGKFVEPDESRNYKGFNYKQYLKTKKIYGSIKSKEVKILEKDSINIILRKSNNIRNKIIEVTNNALSENTNGLLIGLLIGDKTEISEDVIQDFKNSNLSHILATSGTHISYIILGITYLLLKIKTPKRISYFLIDLILIFFMFIAGFTASVTRAGIMGIILTSSKIVYRKQDTLTSIATSLIVILIYNPFSIYDIGLQLSYLGTLGIIMFNSKILNVLERKLPKKISKMISITVSAQILIIPIIILKFNTISLTFLLSNILAIPLVGIIILYGYINIFIGLFNLEVAKMFAIILEILLKILILISNVISKIPFSNILLPTPGIIYIIFYYLIVTNLTKKRILRILIIIFVAIIIMNIIYNFIPKKLEVHVIDVGQGDCELIITPNGRKILIDGGEKENVLLKYLLDKQILRIDYMMISHFDSDHCYNLIEVLENLSVKNVIISKQMEETELFKEIISMCMKKRVNIIVVEAGNEIKLDENVRIKILWPVKTMEYGMSTNNNSIVAKLEYNSFSMIFTGDIEEKVENKILELYSENELQATALKVAHHGSKSSSTDRLINKINPKISVIGVGKDNKFGHPSNEVIERLQKCKSHIFRTDLNGEITIKINKKGKILLNKMLY